MARITLCDRCGAQTTHFSVLEEHDPYKIPELGSARADALDSKDICASCLTDYRIWIRSGKQDLSAERLKVEEDALAGIYAHRTKEH